MKLPRSNLRSLFWLLIAAVFLLGPIAVGRMGSYMRYVGDDYCYSSALKTGGFVGGQVDSFQMVQRFNGDRYSLTLFSFMTELFGPRGNAVAISVMVALWLAGLFAVFNQLTLLFGMRGVRLPILAVTSVITYFILLMYPDLFSVLYWVSAMYTYFAPMVAMVWISAGILYLLRAKDGGHGDSRSFSLPPGWSAHSLRRARSFS